MIPGPDYLWRWALCSWCPSHFSHVERIRIVPTLSLLSRDPPMYVIENLIKNRVVTVNQQTILLVVFLSGFKFCTLKHTCQGCPPWGIIFLLMPLPNYVPQKWAILQFSWKLWPKSPLPYQLTPIDKPCLSTSNFV